MEQQTFKTKYLRKVGKFETMFEKRYYFLYPILPNPLISRPVGFVVVVFNGVVFVVVVVVVFVVIIVVFVVVVVSSLKSHSLCQNSKVALTHPVTQSLTKVRYKAARAAKKNELIQRLWPREPSSDRGIDQLNGIQYQKMQNRHG